ncbi:prominin-like protein [Drosophila miranda]|uniref:prominin-like protein n=1 Tax=Drosophila miranda TaxID=7229 RepID=UPI00143F1A69|nr:prominin-like protein [Drosophila miranda]
MGYPPFSRDTNFFTLASPAGGDNTVKSDVAKIVRSDAEEAAASPDGGATADSADSGYVFRQGYVGHGTTHEQLGQKHWPSVEYTNFKGSAIYSLDLASTTKALSFVYNVTHFIYDMMVTNSRALPQGYVVATADEELVLGPKVIQNDWAALLDRYWLLLIFVLFLLAWIVVIPFVG